MSAAPGEGSRPGGTLRVVLIGPESTGKTSLAERLAAHYRAPWSAEFAREYAAGLDRTLAYADVEPIARGQRSAEDAVLAGASGRRLVIHDTDLVSTLVYSRHYYGDCPGWIERAARERLAGLYLLHHTDVGWVADGNQRDQPERREELFERFRVTLDGLGATRVDVLGHWNERTGRARAAIDALVADPAVGLNTGGR